MAAVNPPGASPATTSWVNPTPAAAPSCVPTRNRLLPATPRVSWVAGPIGNWNAMLTATNTPTSGMAELARCGHASNKPTNTGTATIGSEAGNRPSRPGRFAFARAHQPFAHTAAYRCRNVTSAAAHTTYCAPSHGMCTLSIGEAAPSIQPIGNPIRNPSSGTATTYRTGARRAFFAAAATPSPTCRHTGPSAAGGAKPPRIAPQVATVNTAVITPVTTTAPRQPKNTNTEPATTNGNHARPTDDQVCTRSCRTPAAAGSSGCRPSAAWKIADAEIIVPPNP
ncbi:hypothetical protein GCM10023320_49760 [Pseudonocardia adelaidensis]|uniref:Uncharacterized protein n=1 Tax=Pseudonocardia adelaidensis TaxID=648754 RepID=A0ABP9NQI1_9PSEU